MKKVKLKYHREIPKDYRIKLVTLTNSNGNYYVSVLTKFEKEIQKNPSNDSVGDNGWGMFLRMLEYKLIFLGKQFLKIDRWFPSSETCSKCGNIKEELKLSEKSYKCECCRIEIDRDYNAALNIRDVGKEMME